MIKSFSIEFIHSRSISSSRSVVVTLGIVVNLWIAALGIETLGLVISIWKFIFLVNFTGKRNSKIVKKALMSNLNQIHWEYY